MQIETEKGVDRVRTLSGFQNDARPLDVALKIHVVETLARAEKRISLRSKGKDKVS